MKYYQVTQGVVKYYYRKNPQYSAKKGEPANQNIAGSPFYKQTTIFQSSDPLL